MKKVIYILLLFLAPTFAAGNEAFNKTNNFTSTVAWETCPVQPLSWFTDAEAWAWNEVCMDRNAYMQSVASDDPRTECHVDPETTSPFGPVLSARFLAVVSTQEPFISHMPGKYSGYYCAEFLEPLRLYADIPNELDLEGSLLRHGASFFGDFELGLDLSRVWSLGDVSISGGEFEWLSFRGAIIQGSIDAERIKVRQNAIFSELSIITSKNDEELYDTLVDFEDILQYRIASQNGDAKIYKAPAALAIQTYRGSRRSALDLQDALIGGNIALYESLIMGRVGLLRVEIDQGLYAQNSILGSLVLDQASISHDISLHSTIANRVDGASVSLGGNFIGRNAIFETLDFLDARIVGNVYLTSAVIDYLSLQRGSVGQSVHLRGQGENKEGEPLAGKFKSINLSHTMIGNQLQLQGSFFNKVDLSHSKMTGLSLNQNDRLPIWTLSDFGEPPALDLDGAAVGTLFARFPESFITLIGVQTFDCDYFSTYDAVAVETTEGSISVSPDSSASTNLEVFDLPVVVEDSELSFNPCQPLQPSWRYGDVPIFADTMLRWAGMEKELDVGDLYIALNLDRFRYDEIDENILDDQLLSHYGGRYNTGRLLDWVSHSLQIEFEQFEVEDSVDGAPPVREVKTGKKALYNPFAYEFLAGHLRDRGFAHGANRVEFRMNIERMLATWRSNEWTIYTAILLLLDSVWLIFLGFGVYPWFAAIWFMLLVAAGVWAARSAVATQDGPNSPDGPVKMGTNNDKITDDLEHPEPADPLISNETQKNQLQMELGGQRPSVEHRVAPYPSRFACFWYSLENAVPLINPSEDHKSWFHTSPGVKAFFHFQKIAGFLLISIMVASISFS